MADLVDILTALGRPGLSNIWGGGLPGVPPGIITPEGGVRPPWTGPPGGNIWTNPQPPEAPAPEPVPPSTERGGTTPGGVIIPPDVRNPAKAPVKTPAKKPTGKKKPKPFAAPGLSPGPLPGYTPVPVHPLAAAISDYFRRL